MRAIPPNVTVGANLDSEFRSVSRHSGVTTGWQGGARTPPSEDGNPPSASPFEILKLEKKLQNQIQLLFLLMKHIYF